MKTRCRVLYQSYTPGSCMSHSAVWCFAAPGAVGKGGDGVVWGNGAVFTGRTTPLSPRIRGTLRPSQPHTVHHSQHLLPALHRRNAEAAKKEAHSCLLRGVQGAKDSLHTRRTALRDMHPQACSSGALCLWRRVRTFTTSICTSTRCAATGKQSSRGRQFSSIEG